MFVKTSCRKSKAKHFDEKLIISSISDYESLFSSILDVHVVRVGRGEQRAGLEALQALGAEEALREAEAGHCRAPGDHTAHVVRERTSHAIWD